MRHTKGMYLLQSGVSLEVFCDFLGHVDVKTTQTYGEPGDEATGAGEGGRRLAIGSVAVLAAEQIAAGLAALTAGTSGGHLLGRPVQFGRQPASPRDRRDGVIHEPFVVYRTEMPTVSWDTSEMSSSRSAPSQELRAALVEWEAAVAALLRETNRIASGGQDCPQTLARLKAGVEAARQQCETLSLRDTGPMP